MSGLKVTPEQLQTLGSACGRTAGEVRGSHGSLRGQLSPIMAGSDWSGAAAARFAELYAQFDSSASSMTEALDGIGQMLNTAGRAYAEVEVNIAGSFAV
jgi:WXG100 family type VII secretion target